MNSGYVTCARACVFTGKARHRHDSCRRREVRRTRLGAQAALAHAPRPSVWSRTRCTIAAPSHSTPSAQHGEPHPGAHTYVCIRLSQSLTQTGASHMHGAVTHIQRRSVQPQKARAHDVPQPLFKALGRVNLEPAPQIRACPHDADVSRWPRTAGPWDKGMRRCVRHSPVEEV